MKLEKVLVLEKSPIYDYRNENGPGKRAELVLNHNGHTFSAVMFNKVVDDYYDDYEEGEYVTVLNYEKRNNQFVICLKDDPNEMLDFFVNSIRDYDDVTHLRIVMNGEKFPAVYFKGTGFNVDFFENRSYKWRKDSVRIKLANKQYFPNDQFEVVLLNYQPSDKSFLFNWD